jgi:hypothetical protein
MLVEMSQNLFLFCHFDQLPSIQTVIIVGDAFENQNH